MPVIHIMYLLFQCYGHQYRPLCSLDSVLSDWFTIDSGMMQGSVLAADFFAVGINRAIGRTVACTMFGVSSRDSLFTDFDIADDVAFLAELTTTFFSQPSVSVRRKHLNLACMLTARRRKFKVWVTLMCAQWILVSMESSECDESFPYLGILTLESGYWTPEILKRLGFAGSAFGFLRTNVWDSRLVVLHCSHCRSMLLKKKNDTSRSFYCSYHVCVVPMLLKGKVITLLRCLE